LVKIANCHLAMTELESKQVKKVNKGIGSISAISPFLPYGRPFLTSHLLTNNLHLIRKENL